MSHANRSHPREKGHCPDDQTSTENANEPGRSDMPESVTESPENSNTATGAVEVVGEKTAPEEQLVAALAEKDANYDRWLRAQAELENFRRRARKEAEETRKYSAIPLVRDLLGAIDNLERAIQAAGTMQDDHERTSQEPLIEGLRLVSKQFVDVLAGHGVNAIDAVGLTFDPALHEAVVQVPSPDHPPMTVLEEVEKGYTLHDRVVRPAKVVVSGSAATTET